MALVDRNQKIQTLAPDRSDQSFTECIRRRSVNRRFERSHAESLQRLVERSREDRVAVMNNKAVRMIKSKELAKLLDAPFRRRMFGHVHVENPPRVNFHRDEHIEHAKTGVDALKEITGHDGLCMATDKTRPALMPAATWTVVVQILPNRSRRDSNSELKIQFSGNPFFSPSWVVPCHRADQAAEVSWQRRSAALPGFPFPEQPESGAMPFHERFRRDNHQGIPPVEEPSEQHEYEPRFRSCPARLDLTLTEHRKLFAKKQILGDEGCARAKERTEKGEQSVFYRRGLRLADAFQKKCDIDGFRGTSIALAS